MDHQPSFDRSLIIPIVLGGFSVVGIIVVLLVGRSLNSPAEVPVTPSATPFQYVYLGTEPAITTPLVEGSDLPPLTDEPVDGSTDPNSGFATSAPPSVSTSPVLATNTPRNNNLRTSTATRQSTPTIDSTAAAANITDDTNSRLAYVGNWISQSDVTGAHQGTLHISTGIGNRVSLTFTGPEIHLFYQGGPSLGTVIITIDGVGEPTPFDQSQSETQIDEWVFDGLGSGSHIIVIQHSGGGSVNIDSLVVPVPTPTPTRTPTPT